MDSKCFVFLVCDDIIAYKFIEDKALKWLKSKVHNTSEFLKSEDITGSEASVSSNFTKSVTTETKEWASNVKHVLFEKFKSSTRFYLFFFYREEYTRYASEIIGEYLPDNLKKKLFESLGLPFVQEKVVTKRKSELETDRSNNKKLKVADVNGECVQPTEDYGTSSPSNINNPVSITLIMEPFIYCCCTVPIITYISFAETESQGQGTAKGC